VKEKGKKIENFLERKSREKNLPRKSFWKKERKKEIEKKRTNYLKKISLSSIQIQTTTMPSPPSSIPILTVHHIEIASTQPPDHGH
jgi:hypothetical protein